MGVSRLSLQVVLGYILLASGVKVMVLGTQLIKDERVFLNSR